MAWGVPPIRALERLLTMRLETPLTGDKVAVFTGLRRQRVIDLVSLDGKGAFLLGFRPDIG